MHSYHNTTPIAGVELATAQQIAEHQDAAVLRIMADGKPRTPSEVWVIGVNGGRNWLLTSVRRSITVLEHADVLVKTDDQRQGPYGRPERVWVKA